ncbi:MAG: Fe-S cluster assembly protein SufD [Alphaproteobacteria bacterium]|nr:Fe-S cluster assembly protein SufD [Alphaproteobacteria bacterium]
MTHNERFLTDFAAVAADLPGASLDWLCRVRSEAAGLLGERGLPTPKAEAWKYTNLQPVARLSLRPALTAPPRPDPAALGDLRLPCACSRMVFVNGRFAPELSTIGAGVPAVSLADALVREPGALAPWLTQEREADTARALNTAFVTDGAVIRVPAGRQVEPPIHLIYLGTDGETGAARYVRNLIAVEAGADATIFETHVSGGDTPAISSVVTQIVLGAGAALRRFTLQREGAALSHLALTEAELGAESRFENFVVSVGGRLARDEIAVRLAGRGAACVLEGVYLGRGRQHHDTTTRILHAEPAGRSREHYRGVLDGAARAVFQGRVEVAPGALKTDAYQLNENLLLSDDAEIDTKPELLINADDVKCSHGATAGSVDEEALYYLRSRGIGVRDATAMLVGGFVGALIDHWPHAGAAETLRRAAAAWLEPVVALQEAA